MKKSKIIGVILTILCMALCLYIAIGVIVASKQQKPPSFFGISISYVPTDSMEDTIMTGDYVLFKKADYEDVGKNDIIVYRSKEGPMAGQFIIHRIIEEKDGYFVTKGDHNALADTEKVTPDMVFGKFVTVIGFLNIVSGRNRNAIFVFIIIIFIILIGLQVTSMVLTYKKNQRKKENTLSQDDIEQLKKEILQEELARIREENQKKDYNSSETSNE